MKIKSNISRALTPALILQMALAGAAFAQTPKPDAIYFNAKAYTGNHMAPWVEAIAVDDGVIIATGDNETIKKLANRKTEKVDLGGRFVMPGLHDSHVHPIHGGLNTSGLFVHPDLKAEEAAAIIGAYAKAHPDVAIIVGSGFGPEVDAHKKYLDAVVPDRPVFVSGAGGHTLWLNSKALELAGITAETKTPEGGLIARDPATGEPTGLLVDSAAVLARSVIPEPAAGKKEKLAAARDALAKLTSFGVTSFKEAGVDAESLEVYGALEKEGALHQRIAASIRLRSLGMSPEEIATAHALVKNRDAYRTAYINPNFVKIFLDGVPPAMAVIDPPPTIEDPMTRPYIRRPELDKLIGEMDALGVGVMAHAHGDAAIREFLDAIEAVREANGPGVTHQIAHCSMIRSDDAARLESLDAVCEMSPYIWFPSPLLDGAAQVMGDAIMSRAYPASTIVETGDRLAAGSDWAFDNLDLNPLPYLEAFVTRKDPFDRNPGMFVPDQAISVAQAIHAFTLGGAVVMEAEKREGTIEVGKVADFIALDRNLFEIPATEISDAKVDYTIFDGRIVFKRDISAGK